MAKTHYEILEVSPYASKEEIRLSFRKLVRTCHPDVNKEPDAEKLFKLLNEAIEILGDDVKRLKYDYSINLVPKSEKSRAGEQNAQKIARDNRSQASSVRADFKKKGSSSANSAKNSKAGANFSEILHGFFDEALKNTPKNGTGNKQEVHKVNGENIAMTLEITNKEAVEGTVKKINIVHTEQCPKCSGRKFINGSKCILCGGCGDKTIHKKVSVTIPKNPKNGSVIKVPNEGKLGKYGGKNGDLILTLKIKQLDIFKIEDGIATLEVPITPYEAMLGDNIKIPTLGAPTIMTIPPQTNSGQRFKILNAGIMNPKTGIRDDLVVVVRIEVPQKPTIEEIRIYKELKKFDTSDIRKGLFS